MNRLSAIIVALILAPALSFAQTITEKTDKMDHYEGFFDFWWDEENGKIWLEIDQLDQEFIYVNSLAAGVGSNDIGLDRSQLGNTRVAKFSRSGPKILMIQPNYDYRASSENELERKSIDEAFAQSVLWGFEAEIIEDDRILVDATDFFLRDAHDVIGRLKSGNQGNFSLDKSRSAIYLPGTFNFPKNSEFEATLTFTGTGAGGFLRSVSPSNDAVTVRQHHSFVELPDDQYEPRKFDPRSGFFPISYQDYSAPIGGEFTKRFIVRHRLEKKNPEARVSEPIEPIIFYLDNGTPEPVRTALLDGARWWNEAFEEIGYKDAFRVEVLPDDAHPLDVRYNVINWVHRSTRGWSYGSSVVDPRTGEIIKGNVLLGSLRVRQDYMIAEGLLAPYEEGREPDPQMLEMALDRIRQLSAHEIGHTLGIAHNFSASVNDLASVMDYPHPRPTLHQDGTLSLENAYAKGMGEWDKRVIAYGYQDFPGNTNEEQALEEVINETIEMGLLYASDEVARPQGGSHFTAHLWDYGADAAAQLHHIMDIRKAALNQFGEKTIRQGRPMSSIEDVLVPIYLFHRYQTEAAVKFLGGVNYTYKMRGDSQPGPEMADAETQQRAMEALMRTLDPKELALPEYLLDLIPPQPVRIPKTREHFRGYTSPVLDPLAAAEMAAGHTASLMFHPDRAARMVVQNARNSDLPSVNDLFSVVFEQTLYKDPVSGYEGAVQRSINIAVVRNLLQLASDKEAMPDVQALARMQVMNLGDNLPKTNSDEWEAHYQYVRHLTDTFIHHPETFEMPPAPYTPPGSPIGSGEDPLHLFCNH